MLPVSMFLKKTNMAAQLSLEVDILRKKTTVVTPFDIFFQNNWIEFEKNFPRQIMSITKEEFVEECAEKWKRMNSSLKLIYALEAESENATNDPYCYYHSIMPSSFGQMKFKSRLAPLYQAGKGLKKVAESEWSFYSGFVIFCREERFALKTSHPDWNMWKVASAISQKWANLDNLVKRKYEDLAEHELESKKVGSRKEIGQDEDNQRMDVSDEEVFPQMDVEYEGADAWFM